MKKKAWLTDALIGLLLTAVVAGSYALRLSWLEGLELKSYDARAQLRTDLDPSTPVAIVAIDDDSITKLGRWPWPRTRLADMLQTLRAAGPRVIGLDVLLSEPEHNPALDELAALKTQYEGLMSSRRIIERGAHFEQEFSSAAARLDTDDHLLAALTTAQNVVLPMYFDETAEARGARPPPLPAAVSSSAVSVRLSGPPSPDDETVEAEKATVPLPAFAAAAAGVGHVNVFTDLDGAVRHETLVVKYGASYYPSFALQLVARYLGLTPQDITLAPGRSLSLGRIEVPLDSAQSMLVTFNGPQHTFRYYSFADVLAGVVPASVFKDKIVILGPSAQGVGSVYVTPVSKALPSAEFVANVAENILDRRFLGRPPWAAQAELGAIAVVGLFVMFLLPRLRALSGAALTLAFMAVIIGYGFWAFKVRAEWFKIVYPSFLLAAGYLVIVTRRFFTTERGKEAVEASQVETNKMLGLSFQGQGMLDLAFEKFRLVPKPLIDDAFKDTLYNLGLDFERKRQYAKAVQVYRHIESVDPKYKDIAEKIKTLSAAAEGAVFGGVGQQAKGGTVIVTGGASKPTLGRYEIEKELGRGAMGIVYLGKDPKINRQVAIKTLMLDEGSTEADVKEVKERFFREAESAGTLNHPGIVRVFDAGEEHDVCYIAMELLSGEDLTRFTKKDSRLPSKTALEYVAQVADALDYAHQQGIVHRDIKPANIMLLKDGSLRVTDFGIARITASSKTATGTVMGTPSYMSPEQIAGKKVDGRSDLFSLGVTLFELLTGEKPWKGGEGIGTLLFQIANDPPPELLSLEPALPPAVGRVVAKALAKKPEDRYQRGGELAKDLRAALGGQGAAPSPEEIASSLAMPASIPEPALDAAPETAPEPAPEVAHEPVPEPAPETAPEPSLEAAIELGPRPGAGAGPASSTFTPEEIAATLHFDVGDIEAPASVETAPAEDTQPVAPADGPMALVESIMPRVAPDSLKAEDITSPDLRKELQAFQAGLPSAEEPAAPAPIEPPIDPGETIKLFDPREPR